MLRFKKRLQIIFIPKSPFVKVELWSVDSKKRFFPIQLLKEINQSDAKWKVLGLRQFYYSIMMKKQGKLVP